MKFAPVRPATIDFDADGVARAPEYGDVYHARAGALEQARAVFLQGNGLPERWQGRDRFVILETGFGLGHNFLATWQAWRDDPQRPKRLVFVSVEKHPARKEDVARAYAQHAGTPVEPLAVQLLDAWPDASPDLHRMAFENGAVLLLLAHADVNAALRELRMTADAGYLDGFKPRRNEAMWSPHALKAVGRLTSPGGTVATWSAAAGVRHGLQSAGFDAELQPGFAGKKGMTLATRRALPTRRGPELPTQPGPPTEPVLIIGAGLAGAACALALSRVGIRCIVMDAAARPAQGASGNPAGLFHGVVHAEDGAHARLSRAAAHMAREHYGALIREGRISGEVAGLQRREDQLSLHEMRHIIESLGLPESYVQAFIDEHGKAWWLYPGGGWIAPQTWIHHALSQPGVQFRGGASVASLSRQGLAWAVLDEQGQALARSSHVVLCHAAGVRSTLPASVTLTWPLGSTRGQISHIPAAAGQLPTLARPMSGGGYAMTLPNGDLLCGATTSRHDEDPALRREDHEVNLQRVARLLDTTLSVDPEVLGGRVGWRFHADDRLPIVGPIPGWDAPPPTVAEDPGMQSRHGRWGIDTEQGLYLCTGLGSRGITWAPLIGEVLASWITGDPAPLPASLMDALDPRRFARRQARQKTREEARQKSGQSDLPGPAQ